MKIYKTLPDGIDIVEYEDSLAQALADMWNKSGEGWGGSFDSGVFTAERMITKKESGAFFNVYVAMRAGEALGYCSLDRYYKDEDTAYVHLLNVRPDWHGKKIGKELVLMCVNETIARGMPRIDIHTWPGNTKAVPLYKKCGFFWEDRADTTHLSNYIPTVLSTEMVKDFFISADWFADSTRKIDIVPDGVKINKFELYDYEWEKDGASLRVGFEKTGRRIYLIETDDYRIEMTAKHHELAFGLSYPCQFTVKNKSGKELNISVNAKNDAVITFDGSWNAAVTNEIVFDGEFFINAIMEPQDDMRMHPCVLADVCVNGKTAEFGLGIEPRFPVSISLGRRQQVVKTGTTEQVYINIKNGLSSDATAKFTIPSNPVLEFEKADYEIKLTDGKDTSIAAKAKLTEYGYSGIPVTCELTMDNGDVINITSPLHIVNQGINGSFGFELDDHHCAANGLWRLKMSKKDNDVWFNRVVSSGSIGFQIPQLGKPYDDEFNLTKPSDIRVSSDGAFIRFEADFTSIKFAGAVLTEIYEFDAAGTLKCRHRVKNTGSVNLDLSVKTSFWSNVGRRAIFPYDGAIHEVADKMNYGFDTVDLDKIDENWVFDNSENFPSGVYWPPQYKVYAKWGDLFTFEIPTGELSPGEAFESEAFVYMCDVFKNFNDFRNYVLDLNEEQAPFTRNHLEFLVNNNNPVVSTGSLDLKLRNNRMNIRGGTVTVSSPDGIFNSETRTNPDDELYPENAFNVSVAPGSTGIGFADLSFLLYGYEVEERRALLISDDSAVETHIHDSVLSVKNGKLQFKVDPANSDAVYSLQYGENEWFFSKYPAIEPYSWWNPFIGGLKTNLSKFGNSLVLREKITAVFVTETDNFGNTWSGIRADIDVEKFDLYKGMKYSQYYLTLPGVPVMCHFTRLENNTGRYFDAELFSLLLLSGDEGLSEMRTELKEGNLECKIHPGGVEDTVRYDRLVKIYREGENPRPEKLYVFKDAARDNDKQNFEYDLNYACCEILIKRSIPDGGTRTTVPLFCILTEKDLTEESLDDLRRISFENH